MNAYLGNSRVVDFHGAVTQRIPSPGESVTAAQISLEAIRRRRIDPRQNWLTQIRAEAFRETYDKPIYPMNMYRDRLPTDQAERSQASAAYQPVPRRGHLRSAFPADVNHKANAG